MRHRTRGSGPGKCGGICGPPAGARPWRRAILAALLGILAVGAAACRSNGGEISGGAPPDPLVSALVAERAGLASDAYRGRLLFMKHCAVCHGESGGGDGFNSSNLDPIPSPLAGVHERLGDDRTRSIIRDGSRSPAGRLLSPPYGAFLSDREIEDLHDFMRTFTAPGEQP